MNVSVVDLSANQKKLQVEIPARKVQQELDKRYRELGKRVRIKGFRPGKIPMNILKSYYGKSVEQEVSSEFIQESFPDALRDADLKPLIEADLGEMKFEDSGSFTYTAVIDVCPPFEVEGYKGLNVSKPVPQVSEDEQQAELERLRQDHAQLRALEPDHAIQEGDSVLMDFTPWADGSVFEKGKTTDHLLEVGKNALHPDFDGHLIGHRSGDVLSFELDYPEDTQTREIAGKRVRFEVVIKEVKEKVLPELNDEFAQELGQFETLDALNKEIAAQILKRAEEQSKAEARRQIVDQLLEKVSFEVSPRVVEREVDRQIELFQHQFASQGLKLEDANFNTPEIRAEYRPQAERNIRWRLIVQQIAKQESIQLADEELEEIYRNVARMTRMDIEKVKQDYADSAIVEQSRESKTQEKVLQLIEDEAVYNEAPEKEKASDQE